MAYSDETKSVLSIVDDIQKSLGEGIDNYRKSRGMMCDKCGCHISVEAYSTGEALRCGNLKDDYCENCKPVIEYLDSLSEDSMKYHRIKEALKILKINSED